MTLSEFTMGTYVGPGGAKQQQQQQRDFVVEPKGLTLEEMFMLPTGPKERSSEEIEHDRFNRGFQSYGRVGTHPARNQERKYGGFDDERRPSPRAFEFDQPSRADEVDNWAMAKRSLPPPDSGRNDRYGSLGRGSGLGGSRADEVDNWAKLCR